MAPFIPVLAELGSIEKTIVTVLAVAGGFFVGFILCGVLAGFLAKFVFKKKAPQRLVHYGKVGGGGMAAFAVYMLLTGVGGLGFGGRGGSSSLSRDKGEVAAEKKTPEESRREQPAPTEAERTGTVEIHVLGAESPNERFFRFGDEPSPLTEAELIRRINEHDKNADPKPRLLKIVKGDADYSAQQSARIFTVLNEAFIERGIDVVPLTDAKDAD